MRNFRAMVGLGVALCLVFASAGQGAELYGLKKGTPDLKSAGPMAFGPFGILFVGDTAGAAVFAIDTGDTAAGPANVQLAIDGLNEKVAKSLAVTPEEVQINDLAVNPLSGNVYLSVGKSGSRAAPALLQINASAEIRPLSLDGIPFAKAILPNPPEDKITGEGRRRGNRRSESITDLAFVDSQVIVSGLSSEKAPSNIRALAFPFAKADSGANLEIYHGAHGRVEDYAPIRTFVPFNIAGEPHLLAGFTCTPLVKFPLSGIAPGQKVRGTTVAELGNRNRPLDMIVYKKGGKDYLLLTNSSRGVMKISTDNIESREAISERVSGGGTAGQPYETIDQLKNVVQMDRLGEEKAVILVQTDSGSLDLKTVPLP